VVTHEGGACLRVSQALLYCTNASRGLSVIAEFLVNMAVVCNFFYLQNFDFHDVYILGIKNASAYQISLKSGDSWFRYGLATVRDIEFSQVDI